MSHLEKRILNIKQIVIPCVMNIPLLLLLSALAALSSRPELAHTLAIIAGIVTEIMKFRNLNL
jgi:hypothetical protein